MLRNSLALFVITMLVACLGCSGENVEDQERFQSNTPAEVNISNVIRDMVADLKDATTAEGGASLETAVQGAVESFDSSFDASLLSSEDQEKAKQISALIKEVNEDLKGGAKPSDVAEKIQQMEDLANQLPKEGDAASE